jgi:subtilisin family serine protease
MGTLLSLVLLFSTPWERVIVHLTDTVKIQRRDSPEMTLNGIRERRGRLVESFLEKNRDLQFRNLRKFWIFPGFVAEVDSETLKRLKRREGVEKIVVDFKVKLHLPKGEMKTMDLADFWHIRKTGADSAWKIGYTGSGVIIGLIDTGFDPGNPLIAGKWHPKYGFFDAISYSLSPYDDHGHGTYTSALAVGDSCGIAPGALFLMAKAFSPDGGYASDIHESFEWFASLADSGALPDIVSGSFGMPFDPENDEFFEDILTLRELGVIAVFAIGNEGPSSYSANPPGNYPISIGVGACDSLDFVADFSSRGPAPNIYPWSDTLYWPSPDWNYYKPDILAPGVEVTSAFLNNQLKRLSGTSASCPITAGGIALLKEKNPSLEFSEIYGILRSSSRKPQQGAPYPNNSYGYGILDIVNALNLTPQDTIPHFFILGTFYYDSDGDNSIEPQESVILHIIVENRGSYTDSVSFEIYSLPPYIHSSDPETLLYSVGNRDTVELYFQLEFDETTPIGNYFYLYLMANSPLREQAFRLRHHTGLTAEDFYTHNTDSIRLSITRFGSMGFTSSEREKGVGFHFPSDALNSLFYGSFALGNSSNYLVDRFFESNATDDMDWLPETPLLRPDTLLSDDDVYSIFSDAGSPLPKGIGVLQKTLSFNDKKFVILHYEIQNRSGDPMDSLYCGIFLDWDIGDPSSNSGKCEIIERTAYMTGEGEYYYGVSLIEPPSSIGNLSLIPHGEYVYPYGGLPDSLQWLFLKGDISFVESPSPSDYSVVVSAGPFSLQPQEKETVAFAIFAARTPLSLLDTADSAEWFYHRVFEGRGYLSSSPDDHLRFIGGNILRRGSPLRIDYSFSSEGKLILKLFDVSGRRVSMEEIYMDAPSRGSLRWMPNVHSSGVYFLLIEKGGEKRRAKVIIFR